MTGIITTSVPRSGSVLPVTVARDLTSHVSRLDLTAFRNYAALRLNVGASPVILTGANGAGKTNLLEALSFFAPGRGIRKAPLPEVARLSGGVSASGWAVAAQVAGPDGLVSLGTGLEARSKGGATRRVVRINGEPARGQAAFAEHVSVVWLTPDMDRLFMEGGSARRQFVDRMVYGFDAEHARRLATYEQAMRGRQRLLRDNVGDSAWLAAEEETMAATGVALAAARREVVARLDAAISEEEGLREAPFPIVRLVFDGEVESWLDDGPALEAEDRLRATLAGRRARDGEAGRALHGAHRSDLVVRHRGKEMAAALCSTGEQKALLIAIILAHARLLGMARGAAPIILLDEVAAHLDEGRRVALAERILALGAQAWLTGTDTRLFEAFDGQAQRFEVSSGSVRQI
ncbi:MAG: DNA replication/repair protein RecF [Alphaproteobacteria bacterium]|nr:DNA replication/repair protein RecF [Alphaproteobacteria bacterium]